jgi:hypothetical protein
MKDQQNIQGKVKLLGMGHIDGAWGPVISITRQLLDGYRLIMRTDAGVWYAYNDDIKKAVENYGCGLRVLEIREIEDENIEVVFEGLPEESPKEIYVNGIRKMSPANSYILATDFAGEFYMRLYIENINGTRTFLWGDGWIDK